MSALRNLLSHRTALSAALASLLLAWIPGASLAGRAGKPRDPTDEVLDVLGRPLPWGPEVRGARLCVHTVRTRLLYGEPVEVWLHTLNLAKDGPYVRLAWEGTRPTVSVSLTTEAGESVPFTWQLFRQGDGTPGSTHAARLSPRGRFARGRYFVPGRYLLRVTVEAQQDRADPIAWVGKLEAPTIALEILEGGPDARRQLVPPKLRERAAALIRDLDAKSFKVREAAEKALTAVAFDALPLLEEAAESRSAETAARARRILQGVLQPTLKTWSEAMGYAVWHEGAPLLAYLGEPSWRLVREHFRGQPPAALRALAAVFGPVTVHRAPDRLSAEEKRQLAADLEDPDPAKRIRATRSLPRTDDAALLKLLVARLADPFSFSVPSPCRAFPVFPVLQEARDAVAWQGAAVIDPLLTFARARDGSAQRTVAGLLGEIGQDPRTLKYLEELLAAPDGEAHRGVLEALQKLGRPGVPLLRRIVEDPTRHPYLRRDALPLLGQYGDAKAHGPLLCGLLADPNGELVGAAARAAGELRVPEALPSLKRIALDEAIDQNIRYAALAGVVRLADHKQAEEVLLGLLGRRTHGGVRGHAILVLARLDCRRAIPAALDALGDPDWYVRATADHALRGFAGLPGGVGYEAGQPDPARWRRWWEGKK